MITKWKLFNFKSIRDETDLEFGPLTIFAGSNSSGKSTVLQSILMVSQTLASQVSARSVLLNGPLVKLGQFDDLRSFTGAADQILIGWKCKPLTTGTPLDFFDDFGFLGGDNLEEVSCDVSFDVDPSSPKLDMQQLQPRLFACTITSLNSEQGMRNKSQLSIRRAHSEPVEKARQLDVQIQETGYLSGLEFDVELDGHALEEVSHDMSSAKPVGCLTERFLPNRLVFHYDSVRQQALVIASAILQLQTARGSFSLRNSDTIIPPATIELVHGWLGDLSSRLLGHDPAQLSLFPSFSVADWNERFQRLSRSDQLRVQDRLSPHQDELVAHILAVLNEEQEHKFRLGARSLPRDIASASSYLGAFFSRRIRYLGPLRDEPKPLYPLTTNLDPMDIGLKGEHTAAVLDLHKDDLVRYLPSANFQTPQVAQDDRTRTLERAVLDWLQYMGVAEELETRDRGKLGHELKITTPGTEMLHDLTHVGVGVSQVLPILVMCLLAEPDTTLIIEQPELHLHPKVQTLLGDFFLSMAVLKKQIIVETHSEYIVNRLRFRAAASSGKQITDLMKLYFAEKKEGASQFREVSVNRYGAITDWPEGFFDQTQSEAEEILRAATRKRKAERGD